MRILITGSTTWSDKIRLYEILQSLPDDSVFVTGDTSGIDALVAEFGKDHSRRVDVMQKSSADYTRCPGSAWKSLNERMMNAGIDLVVAIHPEIDNPDHARGTRHVLDLAEAVGLPIVKYSS